MKAAVVQKNRPTLYERDMHHCPCCTPPCATLATDTLLGFGAGMPQFKCPKTGIVFRYSPGADSYIAGRTTRRLHGKLLVE